MTVVNLQEEHDIPEGILRALAAPVVLSDLVWYLGAEREGSWLVATVYPTLERSVIAKRQWGVVLRGKPDSALAYEISRGLIKAAQDCACDALVVEPVPTPGPMDSALGRAGFLPIAYYQTTTTSIANLLRAFSPAVNSASLHRAGFTLVPLIAAPAAELATLFLQEIGRIPPHVMHASEVPDVARVIDCSRVLLYKGVVIAAVVARLTGRGVDMQALACGKTFREHQAFSWMLKDWVQGLQPLADHCVFTYAEANTEMADIAQRVDAQMLFRQVRRWHEIN